MLLADAIATERAGADLGRQLRRGEVVAIRGELGAGKTTLARGLIRALGFTGDIASPTFPIVQVYDGPGMAFPLWHVDLYRIERAGELDELGLDEARAEAALVIEWPERLGTRLWSDSLLLSLVQREGGERALTAQVPAAWEGRWPR